MPIQYQIWRSDAATAMTRRIFLPVCVSTYQVETMSCLKAAADSKSHKRGEISCEVVSAPGLEVPLRSLRKVLIAGLCQHFSGLICKNQKQTYMQSQQWDRLSSADTDVLVYTISCLHDVMMDCLISHIWKREFGNLKCIVYIQWPIQ